MHTNSYVFERCFLRLVEKLVRQAGMSDADFSAKAFQGSENPAKAWQHLRNGNRGKYRRVTLEDAYGMAIALGKDFTQLYWKTHDELENGWSLAQDGMPTEKKAAGRPLKNKAPKKHLPEEPRRGTSIQSLGDEARHQN